MATLTVNIEAGNAAMLTGQDAADVLARLSRYVGDTVGNLSDHVAAGVLRDANGNRVGTWDLS